MSERETHSHPVQGGRGHWWVAEHAHRINTVDLTRPVILAADGSLMDGGHRIAKAYLLGQMTVRARRFALDPERDWIVPADSN